MNDSKKYRRPWGTARIRYNILGFNFHLYRSPSSFRMNSVKLDLFWMDRTNNPPFGKGLTHRKWIYRLNKVCPKQLSIREWCDSVKYTIERIPRNIRYWFIDNIRCRIFPYNVIKINTLDRTYKDKKTLLEHGVFQILDDFVKAEPDKVHDYEHDETWNKWWAEVKFLHNWWCNYDTWEKNWEDKLDLLYKEENLDITKLSEMEKEKENEFEDKLIRVIKIRHGLWI